ncbi:MAG: cardiolipin synthase [Ectobacillus sp.]
MKKVLFILTAMLLIVGFMIWDMEAGRKNIKKQEDSLMRYGNFQLLTSGHQFYTSLFSDILNAKSYVHLHFFIIRNDKASKEFLSILKEKAKSGVEVKLSVDRIGSYKLKTRVISDLRASGVEFTFSRNPQLKHLFYTLQNRNHRRIAVIDGKIAYTGGFNIGKEYLGENKKFGYWRDYQVRVSGDGVQDMERQFLQDWERDTGEGITPHPIVTEKGDTKYEYVFTDGIGLASRYKDLFQQAEKSIIIATPYFVPGKEMMNELLAVRKRGVALTILVPIESDVLFARQAAYPYLRKLMKAGAAIYQYRNGFFHGKVTMVDGKFADIGTANFDNRSFYINDESNCFIYGGPVISDIQKALEQDFRNSKRLTDSYFQNLGLWERFMEKGALIISYYL